MGAETLAVSVIVPTKGRPDVLRTCLEHLTNQTLAPDRYEILVVDDDAEDAAEKIVLAAAARATCAIRHLRGPSRGVAAARNVGIREARAPITVIIGNDTIVEPEFIAQHLRFHEQYPDERYAVLGRTKLHPNSRQAPFMESWGDLPYWEIEGRIEVPCYYFWTGNISTKKNFLVTHGMFEEDFRRIGFEDTEIGLRLSRHGLQILYNKDAIGYHDHPYSFDEACRQQVSHGYNFGILVEKLVALGLAHHAPILGEKYGIIGWYRTPKGWTKSLVKRWLLHHPVVMSPLERWLRRQTAPGSLAVFMYPKLFSYYTNRGYREYRTARAAAQHAH
jgi:GT2 family glycosyltransferase